MVFGYVHALDVLAVASLPPAIGFAAMLTPLRRRLRRASTVDDSPTDPPR